MNLGLGEYVSEDDMWKNKKLKPGAAIQVWGRKDEFEKLRNLDDIKPYGTSMIFVKYLPENKIQVRHFENTEIKSQDEYEVWIAANFSDRKQQNQETVENK